MVDDKKLIAELETIEWPVEPHGKNTFKCVRSTDEGDLNVFIRLSDNWLTASIVPFLTTRGQNSFDLARWLLRMNRDMLQSKFAYDEDGDVVLSVELPTESLDSSEIHEALDGLVRYAVKYRATLRSASRK